MIVNFNIRDDEIASGCIYETTLPATKAKQLLEDAVKLLNTAYELRMDALDETELSDETKGLLTEDKIVQISNLRDDGWVTDTAIAMINLVYEDKVFVWCEDVLNYTYTE